MRFRNYRNRHNKKNRIYSQEELLEMTLNNLFDNEPLILAQDSDIGIPSIEELRQSPNTRWIDKYTDEYGQQHGGYYGSIGDYDEFIAPKMKFPPHVVNPNKPFLMSMTDQKSEKSKWNDVNANDLDEYLDKNIINSMPKEKKQEYEKLNNILEGRIEKNIYQDKAPEMYIENSQNKTTKEKYEGLRPITALQKVASKVFGDDWIENEYYRNALKLKDGEPLTDKFLQENDVYSYKDITDPEKSKYYKEQLAKMYGFDVNDPEINEKLKDKVIIVPKETSRLYQHTKNSEAMEKWILENYDRIKNGEKPLQDSIEFPLDGLKGAINNKKRGLFATIHRANIQNAQINDDGSITFQMNDPYNYEKWKKRYDGTGIPEKTKDFVYNRYVDINNNAQEQQDIKQLEQYFTSMAISLTKEEIEEILKKQRKKLFKY